MPFDGRPLSHTERGRLAAAAIRRNAEANPVKARKRMSRAEAILERRNRAIWFADYRDRLGCAERVLATDQCREDTG